MFANLVMLMSPTWGYRTSYVSYLFLSICYLIVIDDNLKKNKLLDMFVISIVLF